MNQWLLLSDREKIFSRRPLTDCVNTVGIDSENNMMNCENKEEKYPELPSCPMVQEWTYTMRRSMQEIVPNLFLGPYSSAVKSKLDALESSGITHIICIRHRLEAHYIRPNFPDKFRYLVLDIADSPMENIISHFGRVKMFIDDCLHNFGKCLVHGNAGISRSAAFVLGYLMQKYGLTLKRAFQVVQSRRFCINPNEGFLAQLIEFEPIYRAQRIFQNNGQHSEIFRNKRPLDC
ncbi:serine/threonine/tyrosine-interacting protein-like isoform X5 [Nilaparvata lugens]|uniref:serine/threonine/tyrosine-interacting protein-like isoform X5 n=1 Tax=Nilaparvata lugens TaxID=108931 RepID=UPI000B995903|nr:serine/threonine/tyrosine-interacting protein-like isoform X5 [Nilaparvata lugens]